MAAEVCDGYSFLLAAEDVLPIVLGGVGFFALARRIARDLPRRAWLAYAVAGVLVAGSALAGPTRKALIAGGAECADVADLRLPFFCALPLGFALLAWLVRRVRLGRDVAVWPYGLAVLAAWAGFAATGKTTVLLGVGGLLAVTMGFEAAALARRQGDRLGAVLFVLYSVGTLGLPVIAAVGTGSPAGDLWGEQAVNTMSQGLFALAAVRLLRGAAAAADVPREQ